MHLKDNEGIENRFTDGFEMDVSDPSPLNNIRRNDEGVSYCSLLILVLRLMRCHG